jgi:hypothetical protein
MHSKLSGGSSARYNPEDPRSVIVRAIDERDQAEAEAVRVAERAERFARLKRERDEKVARGELPPPLPEPKEDSWFEVAMIIGGVVLLIALLGAGIVGGVIYFFPN